jgi:hypothetical protein
MPAFIFQGLFMGMAECMLWLHKKEVKKMLRVNAQDTYYEQGVSIKLNILVLLLLLLNEFQLSTTGGDGVHTTLTKHQWHDF